MDRYVCPPWYECPCEAGMPVSISTMKRHRKEANAVRRLLGRGLFARGPKVTPQMTIPYIFPHRDTLEDHATDDESEGNECPAREYDRTTNLRRSTLMSEPRLRTNSAGEHSLNMGSDPIASNVNNSNMRRNASQFTSAGREQAHSNEHGGFGELSDEVVDDICDEILQDDMAFDQTAENAEDSVAPNGNSCSFRRQTERSQRRDFVPERVQDRQGGFDGTTVGMQNATAAENESLLTHQVQATQGDMLVTENDDVAIQSSLNATEHSNSISSDIETTADHQTINTEGSLEYSEDGMENEDEEFVARYEPQNFDEDVSRIPGFFDWVRNSQVWIELYQKHGLAYSAMDDILSIIKAPCKNWKTVMDNIEKASGSRAELQIYPICSEHTCFATLSGSEENSHCPICAKPRPEGDVSGASVTYIPILPRIVNILRDESRCNDLYSYRREHVSASDVMSDFFDSPAYEDFLIAHGGEGCCEYDLFLTVSTDGFQVYKNRICDVWPVVAALMNLSPSQRYAARNVLPLMFVPGPTEPKDLQSFLIPLINELNEVCEGGGTSVKFFDGVERKIRIHLIWFTADLAALRKLASLTGVRGKSPCRFCLIQEYYIPSSRGYYFPSWLHKDDDVAKRVSLFNIRRLPRRSLASINEAIRDLDGARNRSERDIISRDTGIQGRSVLDGLSSVTLFTSFPPDIMHLFYNVQRLLFRHLLGTLEGISLSDSMIAVLDDELVKFGSGISGQVSPKPRPISEWHNWKAADHKAFTLSYCLILFDAYLRPDLLKGLELFSELTDICFRYTITTADVERAGSLAIKFVEHYKTSYMMHMESRAHFCTYVIHLLLHLAEAMEEAGPLICCSQYWVEKYIGWILQRMHGRKLAAQSFLKSSVFIESCKAYFRLQFYEDDRDALHRDTVMAGGYSLPGKGKKESITQRIKRLVSCYLTRKYEGLDATKARTLSRQIQTLISWEKLTFVSGGGTQTAAILNENKKSRPSHLVAAEMEDGEGEFGVYYGRVLQILTFTIKPDTDGSDVDQSTLVWRTCSCSS